MAPTNGTPKKGTPSKATSAKGTPRKATPKRNKTRSKVTVADLSSKSTEAITFLWILLQAELKNKPNNAPEYKAVTDALGITKNAACLRYYRIRDAFANDAESDQDHEEGDVQEDCPKKQSKSPKIKNEAESEIPTVMDVEETVGPRVKIEEFDVPYVQMEVEDDFEV
ncbi:uncharacterized protein N7498_005589 [Penicillium cinerascens]|uniref:Uncharacterized protein n=1 Tax=Penicillium cinerascens TaxID=70096 RepID=A0A9W9T0Q8_9EURO|nr:uncharacterized protein N7498_005589 [Penicillium cinerascens]KAJ5204710.1 hypothetical protein N7498_005589 [Penicillium cinerascens]